jgi:type I restriction enzyme S subunit
MLTCEVHPDRALPTFVLAFLKTEAGMKQITAASPGSIARNKTLSPSLMSRIRVPLPTLDVQRRIVERLDAIEARSQQLGALRTAIASECGMLRQRAIAGILSQIEAKPLQLSSLLREPPRNGHSARPDGDPSGVPMLRISAATSRYDGAVELSDFRRSVLQPQDVARLSLVADDLLACRFNGNAHFTGRFAIVREAPSEPTIYPDKLIRFRVDPARVDPRYVQILMNNGACRSAVEALCQTTAGNIGLSASKLAEVSLPVPPLADQHAVVAHVDAVEAQVRQALTRGAEAAAEFDQLFPALLAEAFGSG